MCFDLSIGNLFSLFKDRKRRYSPHSPQPIAYILFTSQHDCFFLLPFFFFSFFLFNLLTFKKSNFNLEVRLTGLFLMTKGECGL